MENRVMNGFIPWYNLIILLIIYYIKRDEIPVYYIPSHHYSDNTSSYLVSIYVVCSNKLSLSPSHVANSYRYTQRSL